jgi:hypothetical protein
MYSKKSQSIIDKQVDFFQKNKIRVQFFCAEDDTAGWSLLDVVYEAYSNQSKSLLLFREDFEETFVYSEENLLNAVKYIQNNNEWDVFHLGYSIFSTNYEQMSGNIIKYIPHKLNVVCFSRNAMRIILENFEDYIGIVDFDDYVLNYVNFTNYCISPMLFDQQGSSNQMISFIHHYFLSSNKKMFNKYIFLSIVSCIMYFVKLTIISKLSKQNTKIEYLLSQKLLCR